MVKHYSSRVAMQDKFDTLLYMHYSVANENPDQSILERLLSIRNITDNHEAFLNPSYAEYRQSPSLLNDIDA